MPPPPPPPIQPERYRGGGFRGRTFYNRNQNRNNYDDNNDYYYSYYPYQPYPIYFPPYYPNYRPQRHNNRYQSRNRRNNNNRSRSRFNNNNRQQQQQQQQRRPRNQPSNITMGDYLPQNLRQNRNDQGRRQRNQVHQQQQDNGQRQQRTTTSSYRRGQNRQQQQQQKRFAIPAEGEPTEEDDDIINEPLPTDDDTTIKKKKKNNNNNNKNKIRFYFNINRIMKWFSDKNKIDLIKSRGNQSYIIKAIPIYDEWMRTEYELKVYQKFLKLAEEHKHWAKEIVNRTKNRDDYNTNLRFTKKKIAQLQSKIVQKAAEITDLQTNLGTYWTYVPTNKKNQNKQTTTTETATTMATTTNDNSSPVVLPPPSTAAAVATTINNDNNTNPTTNTEHIRIRSNILEESLINYIEENIQHIKDIADNRVNIAKLELDEFNAFNNFKNIATPNQKYIHRLLSTKTKICHTKNQNYHIAAKRAQFNILPKFIAKTNLNFKFDSKLFGPEETQATYDTMHLATQNYHKASFEIYLKTTAREVELLKEEINEIIQGFPLDNTNNIDPQVCRQAFQHYHDIRLQHYELQLQQALHFLEDSKVENDSNRREEEPIIVLTHIRTLTKELSVQI